ncbi:3-oxoacyl-[acyl-carrier-protein] reductase [Ligilactobacillus cholophilus]|uniref:3-oxoacyl-[acyl-carrier-protein] reductase n=1 Tax=Ligilactobacillus cholophilus TaxID=3050131 RepID=UPI0025B1E821|nr:3-oxoacyl-[acyl-carrier-protein] reductase [Ligilactobacillus cholophilus]
MNLKDKNVLITGSTRGIGAEIAIQFAEQGANIILNGRHESTEMLDKIKNMGVNAYYVQADIADATDVDKMIQQLKDQQIDIDILVNNAGITRDKLLIGMKEKDFEDVININLLGAFRVTQPIFKQMLKRRTGVIINMASVVGIHGNIGQINYAASKAGLIGFTKTLAREGALRNVRCNAIAPGMIESDMTRKIEEKRRKEIKNQIPLNRFGTISEVASCALFLAQNDYLTGQTITVDGGMTM